MPFLQQLHDLVRTCQFTKFWTLYTSSSDAARILRENPSYFPAHKGLEEKFRYEFASSIAASFRNVKVAQLQRWLNLKDGEVKQWAESHGWAINGDIAAIPGNGDNDVKAGVVKEKVELNRELKRCRRKLTDRAHQAYFRRGVLDGSTLGRVVEMHYAYRVFYCCVRDTQNRWTWVRRTRDGQRKSDLSMRHNVPSERTGRIDQEAA